ncbi:MAG: methyl-accepting chemotaxis protein [Lachnospiraceae bacterium]|nr:methyl-accepting chemotaxis protein [Lachnospiraceae bacterium]
MKGTKEKEVLTQNSSKKTAFLKSIKVKILLLIVCVVAATGLLNLCITVPSVKSNVKAVIQNYMNDITSVSGENIEEEIQFEGAEATLTPEALSALLGDIQIAGMDSSYAYVVSADGTMLYHPTPEKIGQPVENAAVKQILGEMAAGKRPDTDTIVYEFKGATKYASYYIGKGMDYVLVVTADEADAFAVSNAIVRRVILGVLAALIFCSVISIFFIGMLTKSIEKITGSLGKLAALDFTKDSELEALAKRKDETGIMAEAAVVLQDKLTEVIGRIREQSDNLFVASGAMSDNAGQINISMEEVEKAVTEIADGATSQAQETQSATENVIVMGDMIAEADKEVEDLRENAREMRSAGEKAIEILKELNEINGQTKQAIEVIYEQTNHTNNSVADIKKATDIISDIAEETNLLSLNASIEAARAGEAGRGFAVVAAQIQQLADQSNSSAKQIADTINSLIADIEKTVEAMESVKTVSLKQDEDVANTEKAFDDVKKGIDKSIDSIRSIAAKTRQMDEARVKVVDVVQNLTAIAQENAAGTEETSASVAEVANITAEVSENAQHLKNIAGELDSSVRMFKMGE